MSLLPKATGYELRLRYGKGQRGRFLLRCAMTPEGERQAEEREPRMEAMARRLAASVKPTRALELLETAATWASDDRKFRGVETVVDKVCREAGAVAAPVANQAPTFWWVVDEWTSGRLHLDYQDDDNLKPKKARGHAITRAALEQFRPVLGTVPMADITNEQIQEAKKCIRAGLDPDTRRLYLIWLRMVFKLSVSPLGLIEVVPKEIRKVPKGKKRNLFWFLYPEEEATLIGCAKIPLAYRVLYAWLIRNGGRITETSLLDYAHLDLLRGRCTIEAEWTKTGRARYWSPETDVLRALTAWHALDDAPGKTARVFHSPSNKSFAPGTIIHRLRSDLLLAGLDRRELHVTSVGSRRLRSHDFRTGFCTMARRRGMPDAWIMARSGHESVKELEQYAQLARDVEEQGMPAWYSAMDQSIPELRAWLAVNGSGVGQGWAKPTASRRIPASVAVAAYSMAETGSEADEAKTPANTGVVPPSDPSWPASGPAGIQGVGQAGPPPPGVEEVLAAALPEAMAKEQWELAKAIVNELGERRRARTSPSVPSLADARAKKRDGEGK
jgi:integrase